MVRTARTHASQSSHHATRHSVRKRDEGSKRGRHSRHSRHSYRGQHSNCNQHSACSPHLTSGLIISLLLALMLGMALVPAGALAQSPDDAEIETVGNIDFQVRVTYRYAANIITQVMSNRVNLQVLAYRAGVLTPSGDRAVMPGGNASFIYTLTNKGNVADTFNLEHDLPAGMTGEWWYDLDENGRWSGGDIRISDTSGDGHVDSGPISPGDSRRLLFVARVPDNAPFMTHTVRVRAISVGDSTKVAAAANQLEVADSAPYISVEKAEEFVYEGREFVLPIHYGNTGTRAVQALSVTAPLSPYVTYVSSTDGGVYHPGTHTVTWSLGQIGAESDHELQITLLAQEGHGPGKVVVQQARLQHSGSLILESRKDAQLATRAPSFISIFADPNVIRADGKAVSRITAVVTDMVGNPVEDSSVITFRAPLGTLKALTSGTEVCPPAVANGDSCLLVLANGGIAEAELVSPNIQSNEYTQVPVTVTAWNPDTGEVRERLSMYFSPGAIVGRLINVETGYPEAGVEVRLIRVDNLGNPIGSPTVKYTDENGYYIFPVPEGAYKLVVVRNTEGGTDTFDLPNIEVEEAFDAVTFPPVTIRGRLVDRATGEGMPHAVVDLFDENGVRLATTTTDAEGDYTFVITEEQRQMAAQSAGLQAARLPGVGAGAHFRPQGVSLMETYSRPTWRVRARTQDGRGAEKSVQDVRPGDMVVNLNMLVEPLGFVLDKITKQPVANALVYLRWAGPPIEGQLVALPAAESGSQSNPTRTDGDGVYRFFVQPGYYKLVVEAPGYRPYESNPMMVQGDQVALTLMVEPLGSEQIKLTKETLRPYSRVGERISYLIHVENTSDSAFAQVAVEDQLPADLTFEPGSVNAGGVYDAGAHTLTWNLNNVAPNSTVMLRYDVTVGAVPDGSTLTNTAKAQLQGDHRFVTAMANTKVADWPDMHVNKRSDQGEASIGDVVRYEVVVENRSESTDGFSIALEDTLPEGFVYVPGSSLVDGAPAPNPAQSGRRLEWPLSDMAPQTSHTITYAAAVSLDAADSDGMNVAYVLGEAAGGHAFRMGPAKARVRVLEGLFGFRGRIVGRVFVDRDGDGQPGSDEDGVPGVDIVLDDGRRAVTDKLGFYTLDEIEPGVRSVKLTTTSLPYGIGPRADGSLDDERLSGRLGGWSSFAHVRPNGIVMVDFAVPVSEDLDASEASGPGSPKSESLVPQPSSAAAILERRVDELRTAHPVDVRGDEALPRVTSPDPFSTSYRSLTTVTIAGRMGEPLQLLSNGEPVPDTQVGRRVEDGRTQRLTLTYYGVNLEEGMNTLTALSGADRHDVPVLLVGSPASVTVAHVPESVAYRKERHVPVRLSVADGLGLPVEDGTTLTVRAEGGRILSRDVNTTHPDVQLRTMDGSLELLLGVDGHHRGELRLFVATAEQEWELPVQTRFLPEPRFVAGALDVQFSLEGGEAPLSAGSLYFREEYEDGWRLGARYDARRSPLAAEPATALPPMSLRWDESSTDDLAPSLDRFYVRLERYKSHLLYGDFSPSAGGTNRFTQRSGRATGLEGLLDAELGELRGYGFTHRWAAREDRIPAQGIAGLYRLADANILSGTEEVWLAAYEPEDKDFLTPVERIRLEPGADYEIDYRSGTLLFREPIPSYNGAFQRNYIEVTYSVPSATGDGGAYGLRYALPETALGEVALSYAAESGSDAERPAFGIDGRMRLGVTGAALGYELAYEQPTVHRRAGRAAALQLSLSPFKGVRLNVRTLHVDGEYIRPGDEKAQSEGLTLQTQVDWQLSAALKLRYEHNQSRPKVGAPSYTDQVQLPLTLTEWLSADLTLRSTGAEPSPWSATRRASFGVSSEVTTSEHGRLSLRQEYQLESGDTRIAPPSLTYRHKLSQAVSASVQYQGNLTGETRSPWMLSLESTPKDGPRLYGRYRLPSRDTSEGGEATLGFQNRWELVPGLYAGLSAERVTDPTTGDAENATSWQIEYIVAQPLRITVQQDRRLTATAQSIANRLSLDGRTENGFAYELRLSWNGDGEPTADGRVYTREVQGQLTYREPVTGRGYGAAQIVQREYAGSVATGFSAKETTVTVAAVEAGYRLTQAMTLSGKVALKRSVTQWQEISSAGVGVNVGLQQIGAHVQLNDLHSLDVYARRLNDNFGTERQGMAWELTRMLTQDVGIGVGYNNVATDDPDIRLVSDWRDGWHVRLRVKF